jgi:hypothetical protein
VPNYAKVKYANVYPGVDLVYYGNQGKLEYDFVVQPGADPRSIQLAIVSDEHGAERQSAIDNRKSSISAPLRIDKNGDLVVTTDSGEVTFHKPVVYQVDESRPSSVVTRQLRGTTNKGLTKDGGKHFVDGRYLVRSDQTVGFKVASHDPAMPLVIDPVLAYSTYLGGNGTDSGNGIAVDASGDAYVTGATYSTDFPSTPGAFQTVQRGICAAFISKLNAAGSALVYSTYLGGKSCSWGLGIAVDASDNVYVTGQTSSSNFPVTSGAFQTSKHGTFDAFVAKLNAAGSGLLYSTFLGGSNGEQGTAITFDASGSAYVTGWTRSSDFPITPGAIQTTLVGAQDAFITKLNAGGSALIYSTYLGGSSQGDTDGGGGIAVDASGNAYIMGSTASRHFPTTPGAFQASYGGGPVDAFVSKLNAAGSALVYSTYLGGSGQEAFPGGAPAGIAIDASGNAYVTGFTDCFLATPKYAVI